MQHSKNKRGVIDCHGPAMHACDARARRRSILRACVVRSEHTYVRYTCDACVTSYVYVVMIDRLVDAMRSCNVSGHARA